MCAHRIRHRYQDRDRDFDGRLCDAFAQREPSILLKLREIWSKDRHHLDCEGRGEGATSCGGGATSIGVAPGASGLASPLLIRSARLDRGLTGTGRSAPPGDGVLFPLTMGCPLVITRRATGLSAVSAARPPRHTAIRTTSTGVAENMITDVRSLGLPRANRFKLRLWLVVTIEDPFRLASTPSNLQTKILGRF